jgi:hypothetical protein
MSDNSFEEFLQAVIARTDLQERLKLEIDRRGISSSNELAGLASEMGSASGFDFSADEARLSIDEMITVAHRYDDELDEEALDRVAGGLKQGDLVKDYASDAPVGAEIFRSFGLHSMKTSR